MSIEKVKDWTKKHWKGLAIGGGVIVGGTLLYFTGKKSGANVINQIGKTLGVPYKKLDVPESLAPFVEEVCSHDPDNYVDVWHNCIRYEDFAKFGEALRESYPNTVAICANVMTPIKEEDLF